MPIYQWLLAEGYNVWIDSEKLKPGQSWDFEIKRALDKSTFFVAVISKASYDRRGYLQREIKIALDKLNEKLVDDIFIVPILLDDDVQIPDHLKSIQAIKVSHPQWQERVRDAFDSQIAKLGGDRTKAQEKGNITWTSSKINESWEGLPGYEIEVQLFDFYSKEFPKAIEIGQYIRGQLLECVFRERSVKFDKPSEYLNFGKDKFLRTNTFDAHCGEPIIKGKVLSVPYSIHTYGAGAAHGIYGFLTFAFLLDPVFLIERLESIFEDSDKALSLLQSKVREFLCNVIVGASEDDEVSRLDTEWIGRGTESWDDFRSFVFHADDLEILFGAYHVTCFADGPQSAKIPYSTILHLMKPEYLNALELEHLKYHATSPDPP